MADLLTKNDMQWWKEIVLRHSLEHAVLVLFYGLPHKTDEWNSEEIANLIIEVGERKKEFFEACVRQVFGAHLNTAEKDLPNQALKLLKMICAHLSPSLRVGNDQFYHMWTIGAECRNPEKLKPFVYWLLDNSDERVQQQGLMWLIDNAEETAAHNMYWDVLSSQSWDHNIELSPWGRPGARVNWDTIIKTPEINNLRGEQTVLCWRQKALLLKCLEDEGEEREKKRM